MDEVLLYQENSAGATVVVAAQIDEHGRLLILGDEYGGEWEKEYCYLIDRENTQKLSVLLKDRCYATLLQAVAGGFDDLNGCERLMEYCREHGISYQYFEVE